MKKKIPLFFIIICICSCLTACGNLHDSIEVINKDTEIVSDLNLIIPEGYHYSECDGFKVDEDTIAVTIYFSNSDDDTWDNE